MLLTVRARKGKALGGSGEKRRTLLVRGVDVIFASDPSGGREQRSGRTKES